ncbi:uncharacterized protein LOC126788363 isoform X2 [Argentina anserina]|uniref:uncharacterized protein LOC126788363 isoform X2 n=1 Tax=Argentina anserina TaxID=57926 RepID=UPI0021768540|nr:uncharacterized protein LOC126788363 isoform X2 [Potentilla anserina]
MDVSLQGRKQNLQTHARKNMSRGANKDLWLVVQEGTLGDVDSALAFLKKSGSNINTRNIFGLTPLHIATWRNHIPIVRRLLGAGADPDARDGESGWSSLHRALHFGHLAVASILLQSGASITLEDFKYRTPVDLMSGPVLQVLGSERSSVTTEVFSWGSGANYQLGTGNAHIQKLPCKVDALHDSLIKFVSAAKFHSVAVTSRGEVYSWGFGRGGRLGHPDFDIHSGQAAVITPRQVTFGLGSRRVKAVAAAKHHTIIATDSGEVFTWGSNREGQLGYTSVDTQPTPRRVSSLRSKVVAVAAANKHTAVVSDNGEVFTWGGNREGQLGYGTSNSASNYTPRVVEYLKGKVFTGVAAAKYHTLVLGIDGEVYTWGHRLVTPKRVVVSRSLKKGGNTSLKFHRKERLHVVSVAAGVVHSMALTDDGALFYWVSSDPELRCQQLYSRCGRNLVNISAGKYWTAAVTSTGDVYMWDGKNGKDKLPVATRLHGTKRATSVSVGETHLLIIGSLYRPAYTSNEVKDPQKSIIKDELEEIDEDLMFNDMCLENASAIIQDDDSSKKAIPSLKSICEKVAAEKLVEPRNAIQMLEIADSLVADDLRKYCEDVAIRNLDYIFTVSSQAVAGASPEILCNLEKSLDLKSSEPWSYRRLPTPTATFPAVIYSEDEDSESEVQRTRDNHTKKSTSKKEMHHRPDSFLQPKDDPNLGIGKEVRALRKKLQQIEMLEEKQSNGYLLDDQQIKKLQTRSAVESLLADLGVPMETTELKAPDGKSSKKVELSRKQRRKNKQNSTQVTWFTGSEIEPNSIKGFLSSEISQNSVNKDDESTIGEIMTTETTTESALCAPKQKLDSAKNTMSSPTVSKKKSKKGGLSMFLSGALDDSPKYIAPPPTPRTEGPAWGGAKISKGYASLRDIQDEQIKIKEHQPTKNKVPSEDPVIAKGDGKFLLSSFLPSKPIPVGSVVSTPASVANEGERCTPPWTASGTPPLLSRPSLRDIQMQQGKQQLNVSHSPKTKTAGFSVTNGQGSPLDSSGLNRWFKPEVDAPPSSIRSIQIEEKAMKDLRRFYNSVKVVNSPF